MKKSHRFISLDFLRGVAAIGVVAAHAMPPSNITMPLPYLVDFFFVLSGFVLEPIFPTNQNLIANSKVFIRKRFIRFWPMLTCALTFELLLKLYTANAIHYSAKYIVVAYLMLQVFSYTSCSILLPLWSLSAEWVVNIFAIPFVAMRKKSHLLLMVTIGYVLLSVDLSHRLADSPRVILKSITLPLSGMGGLGRAIVGIGLGLLLRLYFDKFREDNKKLPFHFQVSASILLIIMALLSIQIGILTALVAGLCFMPIIFYYSCNDDRWHESRWRNLAITVGNLSFGIYAWHYAFIPVARKFSVSSNSWVQGTFNLGFALLVAIIATLMTQRFVEKPIQNFVKRRQSSATLPASSR